MDQTSQQLLDSFKKSVLLDEKGKELLGGLVEHLNEEEKNDMQEGLGEYEAKHKQIIENLIVKIKAAFEKYRATIDGNPDIKPQRQQELLLTSEEMEQKYLGMLQG